MAGDKKKKKKVPEIFFKSFFKHIMAVCWRTSQEIVSYWLLGGDAPGLLRRRFEYDEFPL